MSLLQGQPFFLEEPGEAVDVVLHPAGEHADVGVVLADQLLVALVHQPVLALQHLDELVLAAEHGVAELLLGQHVLKELGGRTLQLGALARPGTSWGVGEGFYVTFSY